MNAHAQPLLPAVLLSPVRIPSIQVRAKQKGLNRLPTKKTNVCQPYLRAELCNSPLQKKSHKPFQVQEPSSYSVRKWVLGSLLELQSQKLVGVKQDSWGAQNTEVTIRVWRRKNQGCAHRLGKATSGGNPKSSKRWEGANDNAAWPDWQIYFTLLATLQSCRSRARRFSSQAEALQSLHL